ncbi:PREDICTED: retinol dehydrogenase 12-like [Nicrophorus vespilloides]|uniref:Retinol dehydrogenase 12-like n=1 Tax=Nicrophorus vespilloides TaxID=110193 RepID=A0ABM1MUV6_NICVS|nr:PREDICTED: retinol dehydrogenase 12-like [Nicrophorus vespilloides]
MSARQDGLRHGLKTVMNLAARGCKVIIGDIIDDTKIRDRIIDETTNNLVEITHVDLASLKSVRAFAKNIVYTQKRLDILILMGETGGFSNLYTEDGLLKLMQVNHFGPFLMTYLLSDLLKKTPGSRVVFVSSLLSLIHKLRNAENLNAAIPHKNHLMSNIYEYGNSKLCMLMGAQIFSEKLEGVTCFCVFPGISKILINKSLASSSINTFMRFIYKIIILFGKDEWERSQTTIHCAVSKELHGKPLAIYANCYKFPIRPRPLRNKELCDKVWEQSEMLVKIGEEEKIK